MNERVDGSRMSTLGKGFLASVLCCLVGMAGCGSSNSGNAGGEGGTSGPTPLAAGGANDIFVIQTTATDFGTNASILDFETGTDGSITPKAKLVIAPDFVVHSVASDSAGQIYVGGYFPSQATQQAPYTVYVYAVGATGSATPAQTIQTATDPEAITVDAAGHIYLAGGGVVEEIIGGNTAIFFESTSFTFPTGIAVDGSGNVYVSVFVGNGTSSPGGSIQVFGAGSNGSVTPVRTITTAGAAYGVALDHSGNIYTPVDVQTQDTAGDLVTSSASLVEYAGGTTGSATALKTISGASTGMSFASGVQVDSVGNLYLLNAIIAGTGANITETPQVLGFAGSATGDVAPAATLTSSDWTYTETLLALH